MRAGQFGVGVTLVLLALHAFADFSCGAAKDASITPACQSQEVRRLVDQIGAASAAMGCSRAQASELRAVRDAWAREQHACRLSDDSISCTQASLKAELRYLKATRRCDVNARPVRFQSPDASYVTLHPEAFRDTAVSVMGQMLVDDCNPGASSRVGHLGREGQEHVLRVEFSGLPAAQRDFLCAKQPFSAWDGIVKLRSDGTPYLFLTTLLGETLPVSE